MKLPFFSKTAKKERQYLGIFLKEAEGIVLLMSLSHDGIIIEERQRFVYSNGWENMSEDIDSVLSVFETTYKSLPTETIFFVYSHFIEAQTKQIKKIYLEKIKHIVKDLELKPLGFIECFEAVNTYLEKKDGLPLSAVLVEMDQKHIGLFVFKGGKNIFSKIIIRSHDIVEDLNNGIQHFAGEILLPARIILYDSEDAAKVSGQIINHRWSEELFVQLPRVEILKEDEVLEALGGVFEEQIRTNMRGQSISDKSLPDPEPEPTKSEDSEQKEVMGFIIGPEQPEIPPSQDVIHQDTVQEEIQPDEGNPESKVHKKRLQLSKFVPKMRVPLLLPIIAIFVVLLLVGSVYVNEYFLHNAQLTLYFPSNKIEKDLPISSTIGSSTDLLPVSISTRSADFSSSKATTGKKDIGDKAKGEVTMINLDDHEKLFTKGTIIETSGIKFVLDSDVKVASASVAADFSKQPGKAKITVTAAALGTEGNINKGQRFKVEDLSDSVYLATNENSFSGGTNKTVQVVAKKDQDDLKADVMKKAQSDAQGNIRMGLDESDKVLDDLTQVTLDSVKYSKQVGDEASSVDLKARALTTTYYFKDSDVKEFIQSLLSKDLQSGFTLQKENIQYTVQKISKKNGTISGDLNVQASSIKEPPKVAMEKAVQGKRVTSLDGIVKNQFGADTYKLDNREILPVLNGFLPFFEKNIKLKIAYK